MIEQTATSKAIDIIREFHARAQEAQDVVGAYERIGFCRKTANTLFRKQYATLQPKTIHRLGKLFPEIKPLVPEMLEERRVYMYETVYAKKREKAGPPPIRPECLAINAIPVPRM